MPLSVGTRLGPYQIVGLLGRGGLAKSAFDETLTMPDVAMGTPAYMAPEQREGKECDSRTDIFALGLILFEMFTGKRAASGTPVPAEELPERIAHLVGQCLDRDPENRWHSARDAEFELQWAAAPPPASAPAPHPTSRLPWIAAATSLLLAAALGYLAWQQSREPAARTMRLTITPPAGATLVDGLAIAPDGRSVVFPARLSGVQQLFLRPLDSLTPRALPGTEGATFPFWSPDSGFVAFFASGKLRKIELKTGIVSIICDLGQGRGGTWNADGIILFNSVNDGPLLRVPSGGGAPTPLTALDTARLENSHRFPEFLPDGRQFLFFVRAQYPQITGVYLASLDHPNDRKRILASRVIAHFIPARNGTPSLLIWVENGNLLVQPFDPDRQQLTGDPTPLAQSVRASPDAGRYAEISTARDGTIAYAPSAEPVLQMTWMSRDGKPAGTAGPADAYVGVRISPDGLQAALPRVATAAHAGGIAAFDFARNTLTPVIPGFWGAWSPDSKTIAYTSSPSGSPKVHTVPVHGNNSTGPLTSGAGSEEVLDWSADARFILYSDQSNQLNAPNPFALRTVSLSGGEPSLLAEGPLDPGSGKFSPDLKWVAYASRESGRYEIHVVSFPEGRRQGQVSGNGGQYPLWRKDGGDLFYIAPDQTLMSVPVRPSGGGLEFGAPTALFKIPFPPRFGQFGVGYPYDVASDGRILILNPAGNADAESVVVLSNWQSQLASK